MQREDSAQAGSISPTDQPLSGSGRSGGRWHHALVGLLGVVGLPLRTLARWWRRSIQARVVIGILVLSTMLAFFAGWLLLRQVSDSLLATKRQAGLIQASAGFDTAQSKIDAAPVTGEFDVPGVLSSLVDVLAPRDTTQDNYAVAILGPLDALDPDNPGTWARRSSGKINIVASIPTNLVAKVQGYGEKPWWAYSQVTPSSAKRPHEPGLVVGSQVQVTSTGRTYALFYIFPMQEQKQTLSVVRRALLIVGAVLVLSIGTIAWLVTRRVVTPIRLARRIAERLAAGRLEERMHVRGEDDIARLATSFNQMASNLQRQIRQLEELSRLQRRFVADVSHELRTPLSTVRMASDVLYEARERFDPVTARSAELLQDELDRFEVLLTDLLEISRFDAGAAALDLGEVDLRDIARRTVDSTRVLAQRSGSEITLATPQTPCQVEADARRVERIARNLIGNAITYGQGNDIEVTVGATADAVTLVVRDHGIGLKAGEEALVFNRFWRADPARARTRGGTGLGLSISVEDTALHGGTLDAWGRPGRGSIFRLTLPRRAGDEVAPEPIIGAAQGQPAPVVGGPYARYDEGTSGGPE
ncbi:MAG: MtrAB system histidine kinase MtrB [Nocardioidaceae bacterium]